MSGVEGKSYRVVKEYDFLWLLTLKVYRSVNAPFNRTDISYVGEVLCLKLFFPSRLFLVSALLDNSSLEVFLTSPITVYNYIRHLLCNMLAICLRHLKKYALKQVLFP